MFEKTLAKIAVCLTQNNIPYMIIGGQALLLYGEPRLTQDIDITLGVDLGHLEHLLSAVQASGFKILPKDIDSFVKKTMVLPVMDPKNDIRIDLIFSFTPYEKTAIQNARKIFLGGKKIAFASPEDLIIHKIFSGRPKDLDDIKSVLLKKSGIKFTYIRKWLRIFDHSDHNKKFLKTFEKLVKNLHQSIEL